jgi:Fructose-2,6-bisphosphatase
VTRFFLLRHGETEWNRDGNKYCGRTDVSLSEQGIKQAEAAAKALKHVKFHAVFSSTLVRASATAAIISKEFGLPVIEDQRLVEIDFGKWEGKTVQMIEREHKDSWTDWLTNPAECFAGETGESASQVYNRIQSFFEEVSKTYPDKNALVVAHNTVNRIAATQWFGLPFSHYRKIKMDNTGVSIIEYHGKGKASIIQWNSILHLL